jgi:hypothetical protein
MVRTLLLSLLFVATFSFACTDPVVDIPQYDRAEFGRTWIDEDRDGQNTRAEILIEQSTGPVTFKNDKERVVATGRWISIFTKDINTSASDVDIDHIVPLKWAWDHGAHGWDKETRVRFANDFSNLAIVEASLNRSKGAKGPNEWLPPQEQCGYLLRFVRLYKTYKLTVTKHEATEYEELRHRVCDN